MAKPTRNRIVPIGVIVLTILSSSIFCLGRASSQGLTEIGIRQWASLWTKVLTDQVDEKGHIDFIALTRKHDDLDRVIAFVAAVDPISRPDLFPTRSSRLAYYVNAYNALAMSGVVGAGVPKSLGGLTKLTFFYLQTFTVGGKKISLRDFENDVIRPIGDERVHFALNCMVVSCPKLMRAAFTADKLDHQLETAAHEFIGEARNMRVDPIARQVSLSSIFQFYTDDFVKRVPSLLEYVNRYRAEQIPVDFSVSFLEYDWTVNERSRLRGR